MNLLNIKILGLFGLFDYNIRLNQEEKLTIITGLCCRQPLKNHK